ncbi:FkbM family methyltransferase [Desulfovibrio sp. OttesenSCG-928-O18]|nr:FkbM family methyltransferase [Desulfovibrio sp. OttesenSCG-928-O18]
MSKTLQNILTALRRMEPLSEKKIESCYHLGFMLQNAENYDAARRNYFPDEKSRQVFDWRLQNDLLRSFYGEEAPEILDNIPYPKAVWDSLTQQAERMPPVVMGDYTLDRIHTWILEGYSLKGRCEVEPGDIVLDCGTYTGNTSVYFSQKAGESGHVYGFEPGPAIFWLYNKNMESYSNVSPVNAALVDKVLLASSATMGFKQNMGAGCRLAADGDVQVPVTAIDVFCLERNVPRVDFIKMDIEGAEASALKGAAETIRAHRPKMAISAYHRKEDLFVLPETIASICPGYSFALRHFSSCNYETVLFCWYDEAAVRPPEDVEEVHDPVADGKASRAILSLLVSHLSDATLTLLVREQAVEKMKNAADEIVALARENEQLAQENMALRRIVEKSRMAVTP